MRNSTFDFVFFLIGLIDNLLSLFLFLYLIPVCSEGNIVNHISAKHKLAWFCQHCCVIGGSNNLLTIQFIKGINEMHYVLVLLDFHDFVSFPTQII
jgi:hypothetical protein